MREGQVFFCVALIIALVIFFDSIGVSRLHHTTTSTLSSPPPLPPTLPERLSSHSLANSEAKLNTALRDFIYATNQELSKKNVEIDSLQKRLDFMLGVDDSPRGNPHKVIGGDNIIPHVDYPFRETVRKIYDMARDDRQRAVDFLESHDPLGSLHISDPSQFQCPELDEDRASYPKIQNHSAEGQFKRGKGFIFFQHLRKAGGTSFCNLAMHHLKKREVPQYFCMIDDRGALSSPPWSDPNYLMKKVRSRGFRIVANEWDRFRKSMLLLPGAVFATTLRHPVERHYSHYRFEHLEGRDGSRGATKADFKQWYESQIKIGNMGENYYIKTFIGDPNPDLIPSNYKSDLSWTFHKYRSKPAGNYEMNWKDFSSAMDTLRQFNLVTIIELMKFEERAYREVLDFDPPERILPHDVVVPRHGALSVKAKHLLDEEDFQYLRRDNFEDILFYAWAKRLALERLVCT